ncbi:hypothetical protein [Kitasatospora sp. NPDC127116]|uniref:hypothetical protein n=1 Tax=Kitasatospora sp. NPDC127116 TaxID=3345367 RepID=UPI003389E91F
MTAERFRGRPVEVIESEGSDPDTWVWEFRDGHLDTRGSVLAVVVPEGGPWEEAVLSIPPDVGALPVDFVRWALDVAERRLRG